MLAWILSPILFLFSSGLVILAALFYDHRRDISIAIKHLITFIALVAAVVVGIFTFHIYFAMFIPIWLFGMLLIKKILEKKPQDNEIMDELK